MVMKDIIHIGYPKTSSSWFQLEYFPNVTNAYLIGKKEVNEKIIFPNALSFDPQQTADYFRDKYKDSRKIISHENLVGSNRNGGINGLFTKEMCLRLKMIFPNSYILLFLRNQLDVIPSSYFQYIKAGGNYSFQKYLFHSKIKDFSSTLLFSLEHFRYNNIIDLYLTHFGRENIVILLYEDFLTNHKNFLLKLNKRFDLTIDLQTINYKRRNEKYRIHLKNLAIIANLFSCEKVLNKYYLIHLPGFHLFTRKVFNKLNGYKIFGKFPESQKIIRKHYDMLWDYYKESNKILIEMYDLKDIRKYNYPL